MVESLIMSICPMSQKSLTQILAIIESFRVEKGDVFVRLNQHNSMEYFVLEGICRSYLLNPEGEEVTISFFPEQTILSPHTTRTVMGRSTMNFQALTAATLGAMDARAFEQLMVDNLEIREFGNTVLRNELKSKIAKEIGMASLTAKERLINFRKNYSLLENLVPHPTIASYLGITNISLSRLRKELI